MLKHANFERFSLGLCVMLAGIIFYRGVFSASNLDITPDSVEYVVAAERWMNEGAYTLNVSGIEFPPRYPPFFSILLMPFLWLGGGELGFAIIPVFLAGIALTAAAYRLGYRLAGATGACFSVLAILAQPMVRFWGKQVMTDIPFLALTLWLAVLFHRWCTSPPPSRQPNTIWIGVLIALAVALRPVGLALCGPFLLLPFYHRFTVLRSVKYFVVLFIPVALMLVPNSIYNYVVFGSISRNGYHFWTPVPYDYPDLLFNMSYVPANIFALLVQGFGGPVLAAVLAGVLRLSKSMVHRGVASRRIAAHESLSPVVVFAVAGPFWITLFHLFYAFPEGRFHMPLVAVLAILAGSLWGRIVRLTPVVLTTGMAFSVVMVLGLRLLLGTPAPANRLAAKQLATMAETNAMIVTTGQLVYLEPLVARNSNRKLIPLSRNYEYAGKIIATSKIEDPQPAPFFYGDHMCQGLINGGGKFAVPLTALEQTDLLIEYADRGLLYLDLTGKIEADQHLVEDLAKLFILNRIGNNLYRLEKRGSDNSW